MATLAGRKICPRELVGAIGGQLRQQAEIALEVSTSGHYVMSVLEEVGWRERAHWVHTAGIDSLRKQKYDRLDAKRLARKLSVADRDPLPEAWFPPPPIRQLRLRARQRCWTAVGRTQCRNRLRSLLQMYGLRPTRSPFRAAGREWLKQQGWPEAAREYAECTLRVHDFLEAERDRSEASLQAASTDFPEIARLQTIPGIGHVLAAVILLPSNTAGTTLTQNGVSLSTGLSLTVDPEQTLNQTGGVRHLNVNLPPAQGAGSNGGQ
jgi:transposase